MHPSGFCLRTGTLRMGGGGGGKHLCEHSTTSINRDTGVRITLQSIFIVGVFVKKGTVTAQSVNNQAFFDGSLYFYKFELLMMMLCLFYLYLVYSLLSLLNQKKIVENYVFEIFYF